ncbi:heavy metal-responsive transcriptional regulator [Thermomicrobiaceae bacterium CFH 74404]|uniref:Heavy metal-responsive transcriptional regulator n=1 Tax=Thermalbibacter longus TaxID=2951981 RepID=A0AA41WD16_9BACT|nr:heavy metal-responsive transcriptional regulator [Thermalbibacter longus]MCM8748254.1 heavy metal-responsive transcriptional regulator [Thermalbibacter longus]
MSKRRETTHLRIGELARRAGVNSRTIRFYEAIGLLPEPARLPNGYRVYGARDLERLRFIRRAQSLGLPLDAIRDILALHSAGSRPCCRVRELAEQRLAEIDRQIRELQRLRSELAALVERAARTPQSEAGDGVCPAIEDARPELHVTTARAPVAPRPQR